MTRGGSEGGIYYYSYVIILLFTSAMLSIFGRAGATLLVVVNELLALYNDH